MNQKELRELIDYLIEKDITEFELERGDVKVRIKRGAEVHFMPEVRMPQAASHPVAATPAPAAPATSHAAPAPTSGVSAAGPREAVEEEGLHVVRSPIVGTYYEAPAPGAPPFVKVGDRVENGQILCIVEAMKLMNEIESDAAGEIINKYCSNGQPVEYGQALFALRTE
jgi:acetyl-CoA carboxylase biotin carboxyl carrier protein